MTLDLTQPWDCYPVAVIDTETTGVVVGSDQIVEIAVARFEAGKCVATWSSLVDPGVPIPEAATAVHGITDAMVQGMPRIEDLALEIYELCQGAVPCAYQSTFDRGFLHSRITGDDCPAFDPGFPGWLCPLVIIREVDRYVRGQGRHKLAATCARWGVRLEHAHRAKGDAIATGELLFTLLAKGAVRSCALGKMLAHTEKMRAEQEARFQEWLAQQPPREGTGT